MWVFIDVDGTLIDYEDNPRPYICDLIHRLKHIGCTIVIWSAGGADYAEQKFNMICNKLYWKSAESSQITPEHDWNLLPHIRSYFWKKDWDRSALILKEPQFYIDDHKTLIEKMISRGHGTFLVPFYHDPTLCSIADKDDKWLLKAADAVEKEINEYRNRSSNSHDDKTSPSASECMAKDSSG